MPGEVVRRHPSRERLLMRYEVEQVLPSSDLGGKLKSAPFALFVDTFLKEEQPLPEFSAAVLSRPSRPSRSSRLESFSPTPSPRPQSRAPVACRPSRAATRLKLCAATASDETRREPTQSPPP